MNELEVALTALINRLSGDAEAIYSEKVGVCRLDRGICADAASFEEMKRVAILVVREGLGSVTLFAEVGGEIDLATATFDEIRGDRISLVISKRGGPQWRWFLRENALFQALDDDEFARTAHAVWVGGDFGEFATRTALFSGWGGPREYEIQHDSSFESPRKLVRDRTYQNTPADLRPWLVTDRSPARSSVFDGWRRVAIRHLSFSIPHEVITQNEGTAVVLKGPRAVSVPVDMSIGAHEDVVFEALSKAAEWIYATPRDAESKFTFVNYHLSLEWRHGQNWPRGTADVLLNALASARDAFHFHLQDQSRDALRSLADLRKTLQDEVTKVQQSTRDLLTSLWRDFAIAAAVLALRYVPSGKETSTPAEWLRGATIAAAIMLAVSLIVTIGGNLRYNYLARVSRNVWKRKLYSFIPDDEWQQLVSDQLGKGLTVFWIVVWTVAVVYVGIITFLLYMAFPEWELWPHV